MRDLHRKHHLNFRLKVNFTGLGCQMLPAVAMLLRYQDRNYSDPNDPIIHMASRVLGTTGTPR